MYNPIKKSIAERTGYITASFRYIEVSYISCSWAIARKRFLRKNRYNRIAKLRMKIANKTIFISYFCKAISPVTSDKIDIKATIPKIGIKRHSTANRGTKNSSFSLRICHQ